MKRWKVTTGRGDYGAAVKDADGHLIADVEQAHYAHLIVQAFNAQQAAEREKARNRHTTAERHRLDTGTEPNQEQNTMTASELKYQIESADPTTHFFDRDSMKFFGDSMRNYGVRSTTIHAITDSGARDIGSREVWELYRRRAVKHGLRDSAYFDKETYRRVFAMKEEKTV